MHNEYDLGRLLLEAYVKVVRVNLTEDSFEEIKLRDEERDASQGYAETVSEWWSRFAEVGNVYEADQERYNIFMQLDSLRRAFAAGRENISVLYRRRTSGNEYHWSRTTFCRSYDYTDDQQIVMAYIEDINEEIEMMRDIQRQERITQALVNMYRICLYVDLDDLSYERVHVEPRLRQWLPQRGDIRMVSIKGLGRTVLPHDPVSVKAHFSVEILRKELTEHRSYDYTFAATTPDGDTIYRVVATRVDRHPDQTPHHIIIAMQEVNELADPAK